MVAIKPWERGLPIAANHACQLAQGKDAHIEIVRSVFDAAIAAGSESGDVCAHRTRSRTIAVARAELERLASPLRDRGAQVTTRVIWGIPPYEAFLAAACDWRADLLVIGVHEPGTPHTRLTDTDWQLMRRASCPLLLVKGTAFSGYRTILAAIDPQRGGEAPTELDRAVLAASRCVARACGSTVLIEGSADEAIISGEARTHWELVVVRAPQRSLAESYIGITAEHVAGELSCDVLIVPLAEAAPIIADARSQVG